MSTFIITFYANRSIETSNGLGSVESLRTSTILLVLYDGQVTWNRYTQSFRLFYGLYNSTKVNWFR